MTSKFPSCQKELCTHITVSHRLKTVFSCHFPIQKICVSKVLLSYSEYSRCKVVHGATMHCLFLWSCVPIFGPEQHCKEVCVWSHWSLLTVFMSCTVISGRVLSSQGVHVNVEDASGIVSGDGEPTLHRWTVLCCVTISFVSNSTHPLKSLPRRLADPAHVVISEGESRSCTGESQRTSWLYQASSRFHQLHLTLDTCNSRECCSRKCHTDPRSLIFTHTQSLSISCSL